jgi:hypothetical protein
MRGADHAASHRKPGAARAAAAIVCPPSMLRVRAATERGLRATLAPTMGSPLRPPLRAIVEELLAASVDARHVSLDALGEAIGTRAVTTDEIEAIVAALEAEGRTVGEPEAALGAARLAAVLEAARALAKELGRAPTRSEIAARAGMTDEAVRHALELAKVMQR